MKKSTTLFTKAFSFLLIMGLFSCGENNLDKKEKKIEVVAPSQIIPIAQAESFYNNYSRRRVPLIQKYEDSINRANRNEDPKKQKTISSEIDKSVDSFIVARYVSYDYKTIKEYLDYVEQEAKKADVEVSSLRFYFSNYPNKKEFYNGETIYHPRQNSIMISPTLEKNGEEFLFYTSNLDDEKSQAVLLSDEFVDLKEKGIGDNLETNNKAYATFAPFKTTKVIQGNGNSLTMNRGGGSPPKNQ